LIITPRKVNEIKRIVKNHQRASPKRSAWDCNRTHIPDILSIVKIAPSRGKMSHLNEQYLTDVELAEKLHVSLNTIKSWRHRKTGPRYVKMNRLVRYPVSAVEEFISAGASRRAA
jgi:predicted DNA-binding transcriptional regulator AlpA